MNSQKLVDFGYVWLSVKLSSRSRLAGIGHPYISLFRVNVSYMKWQPYKNLFFCRNIHLRREKLKEQMKI